MSSHRRVAASVAASKKRQPDQFCPVAGCLWRIKSGDRELGPCRKHPECPPNVVSGRHVYAPLDPQCIHCGCKLPRKADAS